MATAIESSARPDAGELDAAFRAAQSICRRHARSFYFASVFLPKPKRAAAYAVYAYCRLIDDAVDGDGTGDSTAETIDARLSKLTDSLDRIYDRRLELPPPAGRTEAQHAMRAFEETIHRHDIPKQHFVDLALGCRMDLTVFRYATWGELERYCYHVAGVVGLIMCRIFGLTNADAERQAVLMGNAMQLTNILRDVKEDADRGRIYLPKEDMDRFGYAEADLLAGEMNEPFRELMECEIARARRFYYDGAEGLCHLPNDGSRLTASAMAVIYGGILGAIERQDHDVFAGRAHLSTLQKLCRIPAARSLARREIDEPVPRVFG